MEKFLLYAAYFIFYSFGGWVLECFWCSVGESRRNKKFFFINRGFLSGPLCPIYGCSCVAMALTLGPFSGNIITLLLLGMFVCDVIEYLTSFIMEKVFNARWWDYSNKFMNLHGRICLQHTFTWGGLSVIFIRLIHPATGNLLGLLPQNIFNAVVYICLGIFALDLLITIIATIDISDLSSKLKSLLSYEDKENNEKSEIVDIGNSGYNDLSKRLSDVRSKIDSINNPLRIKIRRILRGAPRTTMNFRKQYEQLKELPSNFRHEISDIQKDLKEHFFGDYDDIVH